MSKIRLITAAIFMGIFLIKPSVYATKNDEKSKSIDTSSHNSMYNTNNNTNSFNTYSNANEIINQNQTQSNLVSYNSSILNTEQSKNENVSQSKNKTNTIVVGNNSSVSSNNNQNQPSVLPSNISNNNNSFNGNSMQNNDNAWAQSSQYSNYNPSSFSNNAYSVTKVDTNANYVANYNSNNNQNQRNNEPQLSEEEKKYVRENKDFVDAINELYNVASDCFVYFQNIMSFPPKVNDIKNNLYNTIVNAGKSVNYGDVSTITRDDIKDQFNGKNKFDIKLVEKYINYLDEKFKLYENKVLEIFDTNVENIPDDFYQKLRILYINSSGNTGCKLKKTISIIKYIYNYDRENKCFKIANNEEDIENTIKECYSYFKNLEGKISKYKIDDILKYLTTNIKNTNDLRNMLSNNQNLSKEMKEMMEFKNMDIKEISEVITKFHDIENKMKYIKSILDQENNAEVIYNLKEYTFLNSNIGKIKVKIKNLCLIYLYLILKDLNKINEGDPNIENDIGMEKYINNLGFLDLDDIEDKEKELKNNAEKIKELINIRQNLNDYFAPFYICKKYINLLNNDISLKDITKNIKNIIENIELQKKEIKNVIYNCFEFPSKDPDDASYKEKNNPLYEPHLNHYKYFENNGRLNALIKLYFKKQKLYNYYKQIYKILNDDNDNIEKKQKKLETLDESYDFKQNINGLMKDNSKTNKEIDELMKDNSKTNKEIDEISKSLIDKIEEYKKYINKYTKNRINFLKKSEKKDVDEKHILEINYIPKISGYLKKQYVMLDYIKTNYKKIPKEVRFIKYYTTSGYGYGGQNNKYKRTDYYYYDENENDYIYDREKSKDVITYESMPEERGDKDKYEEIFTLLEKN